MDLPIAVGILVATGQLKMSEAIERSAFVGELSLEGTLRPISGALAIADRLAAAEDISDLYLPNDNAAEAAISGGLSAFAVDDLHQLAKIIRGEQQIEPTIVDIDQLLNTPPKEGSLDMSDVKGQHAVKRALTIAAAGGHNLLGGKPPVAQGIILPMEQLLDY